MTKKKGDSKAKGKAKKPAAVEGQSDATNEPVKVTAEMVRRLVSKLEDKSS